MADKQPEWIEPVVALRMLVRAAVPKRPAFANHVTGPFWYWYTKDIGQTCEATEDEIKAVQGVDPFLQASLRNGRIQSRGVFNGEGASVPIDELEYTLNNLDLWNRRLDCSTSRRSKRVFENVHLNRENVETAKDELIAMYRSGGAALKKNLKKNLRKPIATMSRHPKQIATGQPSSKMKTGLMMETSAARACGNCAKMLVEKCWIMRRRERAGPPPQSMKARETIQKCCRYSSCIV